MLSFKRLSPSQHKIVMRKQSFVCFLIIYIYVLQEALGSYKGSKKLSRKKRYLSFPEGAAFTAVFCLTNLMGVTPGSDIFSLNINWGLVYELPNETKPLLDVYKPAMKRRNRRDLYGRVEKILTSIGYDGRSCVLRSLCEAGQKFQKKEDSLVYHILSLIFRFPQEVLLYSEPDTHRMYHYASQLGSDENNKDLVEYREDILDKCSETYRCPFSLIDLVLGYYSQNEV